MRINQNISAMNTYSRLTSANTQKSKSLEKLSSGLRINRAGDDAAGLAISEKMRGQIGGLNQAIRNAQDGISLIQTAEGALSETHSILQRMRELAVQAANSTNTEADRGEIQKEMNQLTSELNRVGNSTEFNTQKLLKGGTTTTPATAASVTVQDLTITAKTAGQAGNGISIEFADPGSNNASLGVTVAGSKITVSLATDGTGAITSTREDILNAINGDSGAAALVSVTGGSSTLASAMAETPLTNGADETTSASGDFTAKLQIGANSGQSFDVKISDMRSIALGISSADNTTAKTVTVDGVDYTVAWTEDADVTNGGLTEYALDVSTFDNATAAIGVLDEAIAKVSGQRSELGAFQNRLDHTINNLTTTAENLAAAESRIRDVDMAKEMMEFTKNNILSQAATSMLAQANQMPQSVLQLLQ